MTLILANQLRRFTRLKIIRPISNTRRQPEEQLRRRALRERQDASEGLPRIKREILVWTITLFVSTDIPTRGARRRIVELHEEIIELGVENHVAHTCVRDHALRGTGDEVLLGAIGRKERTQFLNEEDVVVCTDVVLDVEVEAVYDYVAQWGWASLVFLHGSVLGPDVTCYVFGIGLVAETVVAVCATERDEDGFVLGLAVFYVVGDFFASG